jgi:hypothetical protein
MHKVLEAPDAADYAKAFRRLAAEGSCIVGHVNTSRFPDNFP